MDKKMDSAEFVFDINWERRYTRKRGNPNERTRLLPIPFVEMSMPATSQIGGESLTPF
jgi:hypothetical protein